MTSYDGLLVSVLVEAQLPTAGPRRTAGPCALRGMRTAEVVAPVAAGARLAAAASLVLAAAKTHDHVADGDGPFRRRPVATVARRTARSWADAGARTGRLVGFDTGVLRAAAARQTDLEAAVGPGDPVQSVTEPTETAVSAVFAHTAVLADRPGRAAALADAGRSFGRLAHLLDAVEDLPDDDARGRWNPLLATGTGLDAARGLCDDAAADLRRSVRRLTLDQPALTHALLAHEVPPAVDRTFATARAPQTPTDRNHRPAVLGCMVGLGMCVTCQLCGEHDDPWSGERRRGWCDGGSCDCGPCDACDCDCLSGTAG